MRPTVQRPDTPPAGQTSALLRATLIVALVAAGLWLWISWCRAPASSWNDLRFAPVLMAAHGVPVYSLPGEGALTTWLYGPAPLWFWSPGLLGTTASAALLIASASNVLLTLGALAAVCLAWPGDARSSDRLLALALSVLLLPEATFRFLQADNIVVACGLLANLALVRSDLRGSKWLAALATALALASKQNAAGLALGQFLWLWAAQGRRCALAHAAKTTLSFAGLMLIAANQFGAAQLWHGVFVVPARLPWVEDVAERTRMIVPWIATHWVMPAALLFALRRELRFKSNPLGLPIACWLTVLPLGIAGCYTSGGSINHLHGLPLLLAPGLVASLPALRSHWRLAPFGAAALVLLLLGWKINSADHTPLRPATARIHLADQVTRLHPGQVWLPWAPTVTYLAERRFDHTEDGIYVRFVTGYPLSLADARAHLPPRFSMMLLPAGGADWGVARKLAGDPSTSREIGPWTLLRWEPKPSAR